MRFSPHDPQTDQSVRDADDTTTGVLLVGHTVARHVRPRRGRHARRGMGRVIAVMLAVPLLGGVALIQALPDGRRPPLSTPGRWGVTPGAPAPTAGWVREPALNATENDAPGPGMGSPTPTPAAPTAATVTPSSVPSPSDACGCRPWSLPDVPSVSVSVSPPVSVPPSVLPSGGDLP